MTRQNSSVRWSELVVGLLMLVVGVAVLLLYGIAGFFIALGTLFDAHALSIPGGTGGDRLRSFLAWTTFFGIAAFFIGGGFRIILGDVDQPKSEQTAVQIVFSHRVGHTCGRLAHRLLRGCIWADAPNPPRKSRRSA